MAQSNRTKLDVANQVLLNVNERPLKSISGALGIRIESAIREAIYEIDTLNDWSWLRKEYKTLNWQSEFADLNVSFQRIIDVKWQPPNGNGRKIALQFIPLDEFDYVYKVSYNSNNPQRPRWWTIGRDKNIGVAPYPTDQTEQERLTFDVVGFTGIPSSDSATFNMPEEYLELVVIRASAIFALTHLGDTATAGTFSQSFEAHVQRLRDRDRHIPTEGINIFKPKRL